jgi:isopentenyldiphosphate isomerase
MPAVSDEMVLDIVDQADRPIGTIRRAEVLAKHANFRVAHVFVFNSEGQLLIQRLAFKRKRNPGAWGSSVAAYLFASEGYANAAHRRVVEELGIPDIPLQQIGKTEMVDEGSLKFITLFSGKHDGPFSFDISQIQAVEFCSVDDIDRMMRTGMREFTPTFTNVFRFYQRITNSNR